LPLIYIASDPIDDQEAGTLARELEEENIRELLRKFPKGLTIEEVSKKLSLNRTTAAKYLKKGKEVAIDGRLVYRSYEDKKGVTKNITEIVMNEMLLLRSSQKNGEAKEE